ncbi:MAG: vitamin K epoxide reductase family protein [Thermoplasmata archaeon]
MRTSSLRNLLYLAAGIGLILSVFAALEVVDASLSNLCTFNGFFSCQAVLRSGKTVTLGIEDWTWGVAGFLAILVLAAIAERRPDDRRPPLGLVALTAAGTALSLYFAYVELALIGALCIVCVSSYVMGWTCLGASVALARRAPPPDDGR